MEPPEPIRVWLEPGYDYGLTAAWMLDLVGCYTWGQDADVALSRVPSAVGAYADWLADHALSRAELGWERERLATAAVTLNFPPTT